MNGYSSCHSLPPEESVPASLPFSLSPTLRCQHCWQTQQVISLPAEGTGGQEEHLSPGGLPRAGPGCCRGLVRSVHHSTGHRSPSPASLPLDTKGTSPCAEENPNPFLSHLIPLSALSFVPQPRTASVSVDMPHPPTKVSSQSLHWHRCCPRNIPTNNSGT